MKVLIWTGSFLVYLIVNMLLHPFGVRIGYGLGLVFAIWIPMLLCKKWDIRVVEKEAHAKGLSIKQYIVSIVPPSLIYTCEKLKDNLPALKDNLKKCVEANTIPKRISVVLLEMYKK